MIRAMLIAGLGGFIGTCCRYLVGKASSHLLENTWAQPFPLGTLLVNVIGCFVIGLICGLAEKYNCISPAMSLFLITGFCGGFTTFSSLNADMYALLQNSQILLFSLYLGLTLFLGFPMICLGRAIVR